MAVPDVRETYGGKVVTVTLGATAAEGGTRSASVTLGGHGTLPFLHFEGETRPPAIALEVMDAPPEAAEWPAPLREAYGDAVSDPVRWARKCVEEFGADLVCLRLVSTHPDRGGASPAKARETVLAVRDAVKVPLMIWGCDEDAKDNEVLPVVSQALAGERCLLGMATKENYKTLAAACLADGHAILGLSPLDINIAKQMNILIADMGLPPDRIVMYPTTGALGYGLEYTYSIMERGRLAALAGDRMMAMPVLCIVGSESWGTKEAKSDEVAGWGPAADRGPLWEIVTAVTLLQAGADLMLMRHPAAVKAVRDALAGLAKGKEQQS